ncbi:MAG: hypothetical protein Q9191_005777 [Dirinaria sp. TL-2023a]
MKSAQEACTALRGLFSGRSLEKDNPTMSDNCWQNASCIISPKNPEDVANIMRIITKTQPIFSIRSGGHDFNVNHSSVGQGGVLIDMVDFNQTTLSNDRKTMTIGVGARWGDVYRALNGSGVSINGARSPNPGVGGQTLGGGIGWFSNLAGASAASVVAAEVVLANSSIVRASKETNSDLLWALKGGGPNFGVVTSFTYATLPIDKIWYESRLYAADKNHLLLNALVLYQEMAVNDTKANIVYQLSESASSPQSFVGFLYLDPIVRPSVFRPFYDIPSNSTRINSTIGNLAELASLYYDPVYPQTPPSRDYVVSMPHKVNNATYQESYAAYTASAKEAAGFGAVMNYGSQPIIPHSARASVDTPLNLTEDNQDWVHVTIEWTSVNDDARAIGLIQKLGESIRSFAVEHDADLSYRFMNDAYDGQAVLSSYGPKNVELLRNIARAYDPEGVFQKLQNGGWLLSRAR